MPAIPRVITVDPTGAIARIVRSAMDLLDMPVVQIDIPSGNVALEEVAKANLVVTALELDDNMKGFEFALRVNQLAPTSSIVILADVDDPDELDEETALDSPFVYLSRPVDVHQLLRVMLAGLDSREAMLNALKAPAEAEQSPVPDMGAVPTLDIGAAQNIIDSLLTDLGAMAIILASRTGETLLERGAVGYIDRDKLTQALLPIMRTNVDVKNLVGGQVSTVQLYDGDDYDVFVLTVGLHHFMCVIFDGQMGSRQFGLVNRFGRRAVEDLIALLGANAFFIQPTAPPKKKEEVKSRKPLRKARQVEEDDEPIELAPAFEPKAAEPTAEVTPNMPQLDPIEDLDLDALFGDFGDVGDDLFDPDKLEEIARENTTNKKGSLDWNQAIDVGILPDND